MTLTTYHVSAILVFVFSGLLAMAGLGVAFLFVPLFYYLGVLLADTTAPTLLAPAMYDTMWAKRILQHNIAALKALGYQFVQPEIGLQASGETGQGRMVSLPNIIAALQDLAESISSNSKE
jgi:phosphopantothenoylcysteine synthetase/decarboxylase